MCVVARRTRCFIKQTEEQARRVHVVMVSECCEKATVLAQPRMSMGVCRGRKGALACVPVVATLRSGTFPDIVPS